MSNLHNSMTSHKPLWQSVIEIPDSAKSVFTEALSGKEISLSEFRVHGTDNWKINVIHYNEPHQYDIESIIMSAAKVHNLPVPTIKLERLTARDWINESLKEHKPVTAGRFHIYGSHDREKRRIGSQNIEINAGPAFGTGRHESTKGCLIALHILAQRRHYSRPLDIGCGSGILALSIASLWKKRVVASDIDPVAIKTTLINAKINDLYPWIELVCATGLKHRRINSQGPYDLIFANILSRPLISLARPLIRNLQSGGALVLSGILNHQAKEILSVFRRHGVHKEAKILIGRWPTLILRAPRNRDGCGEGHHRTPTRRRMGRIFRKP